MQKISCIIVDDEPLGRLALRSQVAQDRELRLAGEATDGNQAFDLITAKRPDLVFLDVQIPDMSGIELLKLLEHEKIPVPAAILVTAYDRYAVAAFEAQAVDYLLKPFDDVRFKRAVQAAKARIAARRSAGPRPITDARSKPRLVIRSRGHIRFIQLDQIDWIEGQGNYLKVHVGTEHHLIRETMRDFEERLAGHCFVRIHRSAIVNLDRVEQVTPWYTGEYIVRLRGGKELTMSRKYRKQFQEMAG